MKCVLDLRDNFTEKQYKNMELDSKIHTILWREKPKTKKISNSNRQHPTNQMHCKSHKKQHRRHAISQKTPPRISISVFNGHNENNT